MNKIFENSDDNKELVVVIRALKASDLPDLNEMRRMKGVRENLTGLISERLELTEEWFKRLTINDHILVAEIEEQGQKQVVGSAGLHVKNSPRVRHVGGLGMMIHTGFQNLGIGRQLMEEIVDLADNSLCLIRTELNVLTSNEPAIRLYKSFGYVVEGILKYAFSYEGQYADLFAMARYRA